MPCVEARKKERGLNMENKKILDACCGSRMFWFDKENPDVEFVDNRCIHREVIWKSGDGKSVRYCDVNPTTLADFTDLPFEDNTFYHVVFDPPHLLHIGDNAWMAKKYGKLDSNWENTIKQGFDECMRVLKPNGTLVFKWNEFDIPVKKIVEVIGQQPLYGHKSGKQQKTHWLCFMKKEG